jgi:hypothetical protein
MFMAYGIGGVSVSDSGGGNEGAMLEEGGKRELGWGDGKRDDGGRKQGAFQTPTVLTAGISGAHGPHTHEFDF